MDLSARCRCGKVELAAGGRPILTTTCACASCREAGRRLERLDGAPPVLGPDGGTDYVLYRKDRVRCVAGRELLEEHRLTPGSPTRRVVARCCNAAMFLDFTKGHWLTLYRGRLPAELGHGVPECPARSAAFLRRLVAAWIAMGFRRPRFAP